MNSTVLAAIIALVAGVIGSLVAPWAQWGVEKRREQLQARRNAVQEWRARLEDWESSIAQDDFAYFPPDFTTHSWYASLRPHLSAFARTQIERDTIDVRDTLGRHPAGAILQIEIERIAREWDLQ